MMDALKELGWSKADLGRKLGKSPDSVSRWGDNPPRYVMAYIELALELKRIKDAARAAIS
ncbi:helix-turn-helix domain-containing protein [Oceanicaulis sp.]|uniref:helix-turn-helix domain-containing protein n=1 Tax=Oceanicaulis sp. TaxID=1924941 RepID=UPI003D2D077B